jgi:hypothetical protein
VIAVALLSRDESWTAGAKRIFFSCATLSAMVGKIDYSKHTELELVDMFGRLDPRYAQAECSRLSQFLAEHGYIVTDGRAGPGSAAPSPKKLEQLIGLPCPFECDVEFAPIDGVLGVVGRTRNPFGFSGYGTLVTNGIFVWISGRVAQGALMTLVEKNTQLACHQIANVESSERIVRFEYNVLDSVGDSVFLCLADATAAAQLVHVLPRRRTKDFRTAFSN